MKIDRPLSEKEHKILDKELKQLDKNQRFQIRYLAGWSLLAIVVGTFVYFRLENPTELYMLIGTVVIYILIGVWVFVESFSKLNKRRKSIEYVKAVNKVTVYQVTSIEYIQLSEQDYEGVFYMFQLANDKILTFGGQDFYPTKSFPSDNFEIAICYGPKKEIVLLEKYNYGKKLKPKLKIAGKPKWDIIASAKYVGPDYVNIISGRLEDIEELTVKK